MAPSPEGHQSTPKGVKDKLQKASAFLKDYTTAVREGRIHPFTAVERTCRAATRDEPWGPTGAQLNELALLTHDDVNAHIIFAVLEFRLMSHGERWRNVYKALQVLEFLLKRGHDRCPPMGAPLLPLLSCLTNFAYISPNGKDMGLNVRIRSAAVAAVLEDMEGLMALRHQLAERMRQHYEEWVARPLSPTHGQDLHDFKPIQEPVRLKQKLTYEGMSSPPPSKPSPQHTNGSSSVTGGGSPAAGGPTGGTTSPSASTSSASGGGGSASGTSGTSGGGGGGGVTNAKASVSAEEGRRLSARLNTLMARADNKLCADCQGTDGASRANWASVNCGVFICLRCAGLHRGLGVHISQVRSVTLDTWLPDQVALMEAAGNGPANAYYEARLAAGQRPNRDSVGFETFVRDKYQTKRWADPKGTWPPAPPRAPTTTSPSPAPSPSPAASPSPATTPSPTSATSSTPPSLDPGPAKKLPGGIAGVGGVRPVVAAARAGSATSVAFAGLAANGSPSHRLATSSSARTFTWNEPTAPTNSTTLTTASSAAAAVDATSSAAASSAQPTANAAAAVPAAPAAPPPPVRPPSPAMGQLLPLDDENGSDAGSGEQGGVRQQQGGQGGGGGGMVLLDPRLGVLEWLDAQYSGGGAASLPLVTAIPMGPLTPAGSNPLISLPSPSGPGPAGHMTHVILTPGGPPTWVPGYLPPRHSGPSTPLSSPLTLSGAYPGPPGGGTAWGAPPLTSPSGGPPHMVAIAARHVMYNGHAGPHLIHHPGYSSPFAPASHHTGPVLVPVLTSSPPGLPARPAPAVDTHLADALDEIAAVTAASTAAAAAALSAQASPTVASRSGSGGPGLPSTAAMVVEAADGVATGKTATGAGRADGAFGSSQLVEDGDVIDAAPAQLPAPLAAIPFRGDDPFRASVLPFQPLHGGSGGGGSPRSPLMHNGVGFGAAGSVASPSGRNGAHAPVPASTLSGRWGPASASALRAGAGHAGSSPGAGVMGSGPGTPTDSNAPAAPSLDELLRGQLFSLDISLRPTGTGVLSPGRAPPPAAHNGAPGALPPATQVVQAEARSRLAAAGVAKPASLPVVSTAALAAVAGVAGSGGGGGTAAGVAVSPRHPGKEGSLTQAMIKGRWLPLQDGTE